MPVHNILYLIDVLDSTTGGAEGILLKMTKMLPRDRFRCQVATFSAGTHDLPANNFPCPVHFFPLRCIHDWTAVRTGLQLARLIREEKIDIVHTFFPASDLLGAVVAKLCRRPLVISSRRDMGLLRSKAHYVAYRWARGLFNQVHAVGEQVRSFHISQDGLDPRKVVTVYNGVDIREIDNAARQGWPADLDFLSSAPVVICVANVRPVKGIHDLVRTASIVCRAVPETRFLVVGTIQDSQYFDAARILARELNVEDSIIYAGVRHDVPSLLKMARVFYLPSRSEGLSNAMLEAMTCGLPCVATDAGGNCELIDDPQSGYLVSIGDTAAAAEAIITLVRNPFLARRMGKSGRQIVQTRFSVQAMITRLTSLYEGLLAEVHAQEQAEANKAGEVLLQ